MTTEAFRLVFLIAILATRKFFFVVHRCFFVRQQAGGRNFWQILVGMGRTRDISFAKQKVVGFSVKLLLFRRITCHVFLSCSLAPRCQVSCKRIYQCAEKFEGGKQKGR